MKRNRKSIKFNVLSKKKYQEYRKLKPNDAVTLRTQNKKDQRKPFHANALNNVVAPLEKLIEEKETKKLYKKEEPKPQVSSGRFKILPKVPDQIETLFDMSKDEWTLGEILDLNITEIPFLVEKLIPLHTINVLAGQSERGKSTLYTQLSLAIVRGDNEFLGCRLKTTYNRVLVISTEDGPVALSFRANKQLDNATSVDEIRNRLVFITNQENLETRIENYLKETKVDLIIIDAFGDVFTGGDINASNSVRRYLNTYVRFIQQYGCSVLFVHHVGKGKQNRPEKDQLLGSTGIEGKMRNVLMLSIVNDQHQLSIAKGNYVNREDKKIPLYLNFDEKTLTFSKADGPAKPLQGDENANGFNDGDRVKGKPGKQINMALYTQAIQLYNEGKSQVEIAKTVGRDKSTICKWVKEFKSKQNPPTESSTA